MTISNLQLLDLATNGQKANTLLTSELLAGFEQTNPSHVGGAMHFITPFCMFLNTRTTLSKLEKTAIRKQIQPRIPQMQKALLVHCDFLGLHLTKQTHKIVMRQFKLNDDVVQVEPSLLGKYAFIVVQKEQAEANTDIDFLGLPKSEALAQFIAEYGTV